MTTPEDMALTHDQLVDRFKTWAIPGFMSSVCIECKATANVGIGGASWTCPCGQMNFTMGHQPQLPHEEPTYGPSLMAIVMAMEEVKPTTLQPANLNILVAVRPCVDLDRLYEQDEDKLDDVIDYLFEKVDKALYAGHDKQYWPDIEALCEQVDVEKLTKTMMVSILTITLPVRDRLKSRSEFTQKVRQKCAETETPEQLELLMMGLE